MIPLPPSPSPLTTHDIKGIFDIFADQNPNPQTELFYTNAYTLLVAVTLSAQATDVGVNKATISLFQLVDSPQKMLDLGLEKLKEQIQTIGLYPTKAKHIMAAAKILVEDYQGQVPENREQLESLPGVGRKTANVILNTAFGHKTIAVDTHIFRVSQRIGLAKGQTPLAIEEQLDRMIPDAFKEHAHHWLILHGRYICKARKPLCVRCPIYSFCRYDQKDLAA